MGEMQAGAALVDHYVSPSPMVQPRATAISRRALFAGGLAAGLTFRPGVAGQSIRPGEGRGLGVVGAAAQEEWTHFSSRFLTLEGRITDNANGGITHSEGQGFAMLLAVRHDAPDIFARCLRWTRGVLSRPQDTLLAWAYRPHDPNPVPDSNNATDGDLLVAWALAEAARKWGVREYHALAAAMGRDILRHLVVRASERLVLLPGLQGFRHNGTTIVNPSYYVFPAFQALQTVLPTREWSVLGEAGLRLIEDARFGRWGLVPDWVALSSGDLRPRLAPRRPTRFSYDAVRVPLYLIWGGFGAERPVRAAAHFWHHPLHRQMPAWVDLRSGETADYAADPGIAAIATLTAAVAGLPTRRLTSDPSVTPDRYYASVLRLLAQHAELDVMGSGIQA